MCGAHQDGEQEETLDISRGTSRHPRDSFSYAVSRVCNVQFLNCNFAFIFLNYAVLHDLEAGETIREGKRVWEQCEESGPAALHQLCPLCTAIYIFILRATKSRQGGKGEEEGQLPKCTIVRTPTHQTRKVQRQLKVAQVAKRAGSNFLPTSRTREQKK